MVEKGVVSSKLSNQELDKKIEDIEINKDTNIVLLTMEDLDLAKSMILLDGLILLGHTIRVSLYSEVKDLSMDNIQKASAMANSANVTAKSIMLFAKSKSSMVNKTILVSLLISISSIFFSSSWLESLDDTTPFSTI